MKLSAAESIGLKEKEPGKKNDKNLLFFHLISWAKGYFNGKGLKEIEMEIDGRGLV